MEFRFAHGALEAEKQPVVEVTGTVDAVLVEDQGVGQGAQFQQPMPVGAVARQPGDFEAEHDAGAPHAHLGDETLEPFPVGRGAGLAEIGVDDHDAVGWPAEGDRPLAERILAAGALGVFEHLAQGGLAHIEEGGAAQVGGGDLLVEGAHAASPGRCARIMSTNTSTVGAAGAGARSAGRRRCSLESAGSEAVPSQAATPRSANAAGPCRTGAGRTATASRRSRS